MCFGGAYLQNLVSAKIMYSGKFSREKPSRFCDFTATHESFLHEIVGICHTHNVISLTFRERFSLQNAPFQPICESFLPRKFPAIQWSPYGMVYALNNNYLQYALSISTLTNFIESYTYCPSTIILTIFPSLNTLWIAFCLRLSGNR